MSGAEAGAAGGALAVAEQRDLLPGGPAPHATLIGQDGRKLFIGRAANGAVSLTIDGRAPLVLDRYQAMAFAAAASSLIVVRVEVSDR